MTDPKFSMAAVSSARAAMLKLATLGHVVIGIETFVTMFVTLVDKAGLHAQYKATAFEALGDFLFALANVVQGYAKDAAVQAHLPRGESFGRLPPLPIIGDKI